MADAVPGLALLGSGVFASSQYLPKLGELGELVSLRTIWSRSEVLYMFFIDSYQGRSCLLLSYRILLYSIILLSLLLLGIGKWMIKFHL